MTRDKSENRNVQKKRLEKGKRERCWSASQYFELLMFFIIYLESQLMGRLELAIQVYSCSPPLSRREIIDE